MSKEIVVVCGPVRVGEFVYNCFGKRAKVLKVDYAPPTLGCESPCKKFRTEIECHTCEVIAE